MPVQRSYSHNNIYKGHIPIPVQRSPHQYKGHTHIITYTKVTFSYQYKGHTPILLIDLLQNLLTGYKLLLNGGGGLANGSPNTSLD